MNPLIRSICSIACVMMLNAGVPQVNGQSEPTNIAPQTLHIGTSLTLVDVVAEETKGLSHGRQLLMDLKRDDFRVLDNGHEVPILTFDTGIDHTARPLALWLIVQCNEGLPAELSSGFMKGKARLLRPALSHLEKSDLVGVAHWCDDGTAEIDSAPTADVNAALAKVDFILNHSSPPGHNYSGELAMQRMIRMVIADTHNAPEAHLPILLFLYGDNNAAGATPAGAIVEDLLQTSGMVFGLSNQDFKYDPLQEMMGGGMIWHLVHYYSQETGGQFYSTSHQELFQETVNYIVAQLHFRYVLGFKPQALDGKKHSLKVELTREAQHRFREPLLRFRPEYIPLPTSVDGR